MAESYNYIPPFLDTVIEFPGHGSYEILKPLTDFRECHYGMPHESRIVFACKQVKLESGQPPSGDDFIMKVKVQAPGKSETSNVKAESGPSSTTNAELEALERLSKANNTVTPRLIAWKRGIQGDDAPLPKGYTTYIVMSKLPGEPLYDLGYQRQLLETSEEVVSEREDIKREVIRALRSIYDVGIRPGDCGLRNVLWERNTKTCSIIDFELWTETTENITNETYVLQRWGIVQRPPPKTWTEAWARQDET